MDKLSAIQQAQKMFQKLVDVRLNSAPTPRPQLRTFPVSTLPNGQVLLSNGQTRVSFPQQRAEQIQKTNFNQMIPAQQTQQQLLNINNEITTPARDLAMGGVNGQNYFVNMLAQALKPRMQGSPEIGQLATLVPSLQDKLSPVEQTSALANLPSLAPDAKNIFNDQAGFYNKFLGNSGSIQDALAKEFASQYTNAGESPVGNFGRIQNNIPLVSNYQNRFGIPSAQTARYAQISSNASQFNKRI